MRKILLIFLSFTSVLLLKAQDDGVGTFNGGVRAGMTTSQISGDNLTGFHQVGAEAGLFANVRLTPDLRSGRKSSKTINMELPDKTIQLNSKRNPMFLAMQVELDFVMKGSHATSKQANTTGSGKYNLNIGYLEMPFLLKLCFGEVFEVELPSPVVGVNLYKVERDFYGSIPGLPDMNRFELSYMAGFSWIIKEHHGINVRYSNSILPVRIPTWAINHWVKKQFNSVIMLNYFYQF